jgi:FlaA1/EpsC-like NDP-sugar epimerase
VTVTDPEVTRFFMTIPEACQLILQTSFLESSRLAVYALDMGRPVAIRELAQQMIRLAGKRPDRDIEIKYTGLRPGEKLHEMLFHPDERYQPTRHPRILHAQPRPLDVVKIQNAVDRLRSMLNEGAGDPALLPLLREVVADYQPSAEWHAAMSDAAAAGADLPASIDQSSRA